MDGKSHYCEEESYSKILKEDRDLRKKEWEVFRISHWDIEKRVNDLLEELIEAEPQYSIPRREPGNQKIAKLKPEIRFIGGVGGVLKPQK